MWSIKKICETGRNISDLYSNTKAELQGILKLFYRGLRNSDGEIETI